ncbi:tRNA cyclic N6-threonylcarbamoyladenosine(37) synthase TcdA [uncultured Pseudoteredinibacter sp.]|uniref:tRNA cyclic N6-threonylcarbamoyladenosine(37) synthase TcdA n=1 Tax=uncultured Pseudoteredinibacter sp. TaxID=1641701 RepID=UPI00262C0CDC|nr:tRNA cyclic N6-threonylcarbamoyladenosine(37) synthase TcdA [uncultured Pseudoteredinibacter sp.]
MLSESYRQRFSGIARLYGDNSLIQLASAHMMVIGIGGVGSWLAEALARSGVGEISLVDMDEVCVSNINRQVHALQSTIGQSKIDLMSARLKDINPDIRVNCIDDFLDQDNITELVGQDIDVVIDAIDSGKVKAALIAHCRSHKQQVITLGSAGGKVNPARVISGDLSKTIKDPLLARVRKILRQQYGFPRNPKRVFSVEAVYSPEQMRYPDGEGGFTEQKPKQDAGQGLDCSGGFGSITMVTSVFAMHAATRAIERYLERVQ